MPSPFPGMDPYLELQWSSFHAMFAAALTGQLNHSLPLGLVARLETEVRLETFVGDRLGGYTPDVSVVNAPRAGSSSSIGSSALATPIRIPYRETRLVLRNIQIVDPNVKARVVTAIELLSPANKTTGRVNDDYRKKLRDYELAATNWVEIDLLRSPRKNLVVDWEDIPFDGPAAYLVVVYRAAERSLDGFPILLRDSLPKVPVPLRATDADVGLDLQAGFDRAFEEGGFDAGIDYAAPLSPQLSPSDAEWAAGLMTR